MKNKMIVKVVCVIVVSLFLFNNIAYGLGTMPGSRNPETQEGMYAVAEKLFSIKRGPGAIDFDSMTPESTGVKFVGDGLLTHGLAAVAYIHETYDYQTKFVQADYSNPPEAWKNNPILQETDLVSAFKAFRDAEAQIPAENLDIKEGYFPVDEAKGELPIARIEKMGEDKYVLIIHTRFVQMWNHIRENDVWFEANLGPNDRRTMSVAWGIFYRLAKHEMTDLQQKNQWAKSIGHIGYDLLEKAVDVSKDEVLANMIGGRYQFLNDSIWLWFLASYAFRDTTRYNNEIFFLRAKWILESREAKELDPPLPSEFPYLSHPYAIKVDRSLAIAFAYAINYNFFNRPGIAVPKLLPIKPEFTADFELRAMTRKGMGIIYATGNNESPVLPAGDYKFRFVPSSFRELGTASGGINWGDIMLDLSDQNTAEQFKRLLKATHLDRVYPDLSKIEARFIITAYGGIFFKVPAIAISNRVTKRGELDSFIQLTPKDVDYSEYAALVLLAGERRRINFGDSNVRILPSKIVFDPASETISIAAVTEPTQAASEKPMSAAGEKPFDAEKGPGADSEHPLNMEISKFSVPVAPDIGPGSIKLRRDEISIIWQIIGLLHDSRVEIFLPQEVNLTETMREALKDIRKREGADIVKCREYSGAGHLEELLCQASIKDVKRIVLTAEQVTKEHPDSSIGKLAEANPEIFRGVRLFNIALPEGYAAMSSKEKTFYQAKMIMEAILVRLYEKNRTLTIGFILSDMMKGCVEGDIYQFLNGLVESDDEIDDPAKIKERIIYCLGKTVSLIAKLVEEIEHLKLVMKTFWTAA